MLQGFNLGVSLGVRQLGVRQRYGSGGKATWGKAEVWVLG